MLDEAKEIVQNLTESMSICLRFKSNVTAAISWATTISSVINRLSNNMLSDIVHNSRPTADCLNETHVEYKSDGYSKLSLSISKYIRLLSFWMDSDLRRNLGLEYVLVPIFPDNLDFRWAVHSTFHGILDWSPSVPSIHRSQRPFHKLDSQPMVLANRHPFQCPYNRRKSMCACQFNFIMATRPQRLINYPLFIQLTSLQVFQLFDLESIDFHHRAIHLVLLRWSLEFAVAHFHPNHLVW